MPDSIEELIDKVKKSADFFYKAKILLYLKKDKQMPNKELADKLKIKPSYLCHILRLNRLPELVVDSYYSRLISISHLFIVSRLKSREDMLSVYENILKHNFSVAQTEQLVRRVIYGLKSDGKYLTGTEISETAKLLNEKNANVFLKVIQSRIKSKIIVEVFGSLAKTTPMIKELLKKMSADSLAKD